MEILGSKPGSDFTNLVNSLGFTSSFVTYRYTTPLRE